ncbi:MAG: hypothetical protein CBB87_08110 [Micavibrio sp. TMED27]|nr:hypothetical protein [Micavibrio sp.]OUT90634.1 MAG: hypothetical protein CBB87_08110 [Micavibrio sp. TMED27]|tara:strand:- start:2330 stop:2542 length:213 start_codon:yes stop_codon:yes gene_type:complete
MENLIQSFWDAFYFMFWLFSYLFGAIGACIIVYGVTVIFMISVFYFVEFYQYCYSKLDGWIAAKKKGSKI